MNIFFRILLAVYAFCLAIISAVCMLITIKTEIFAVISSYLDKYVFKYDGMEPRIAMFAISLLFFIMSLLFLMSGIRSNKDKKAVSRRNNIGEIRISLNSIENIALNTAKRVMGVKETRAMVKKSADEVSIILKMIVLPDLNIPSISDEAQKSVKTSVEESSGITVREVKVLVDSIYNPGGNTSIVKAANSSVQK